MLIGISLGPGDPGLLTFKAAAALKECTKVFVPGEMASDLAVPYCQPEILNFPMIGDEAKLEESWSRNANIVAGFASQMRTGFGCMGDVNTFSTFTHLKRVIARDYPVVEVETIPGVSIVSALASCFGIGLERSFQVTDGSSLESVIRMKANRPRIMARELEAQGFDWFILGKRLCTPEESIIQSDLAEDLPDDSDYFSVLYARRKR